MRCNFPQCKRRASLIIGDCKYCQLHFCNEHRLPESHSCQGMDKCKQEHFNRNKDKLMSEKVVNHLY